MLLLLAFFVVSLPASAHASLQIAGGKATREKRQKRETLPRKGIYLAGSLSPGAAGHGGATVPVLRNQWEIGAGVSDHFTLGVSLGGSAYVGREPKAFNADLVAHRFIGKGVFLRGALGVTSRAPSFTRLLTKPAVGGAAGLGYEFRVFERIGVGLSMDYDLRVRVDAQLAHTVVAGLRFAVYLNKKR
ncbi:MAG: hypothetical protein AAGF11_53245 [Myxococcota bacterium]